MNRGSQISGIQRGGSPLPNIEIKCPYENLVRAGEIATNLNARYVGIDHQVDTYYQTREGRLKLRESSLSGNHLIPYMRPTQAGPRKSLYQLLPVTDVEAFKELFASVLGVETVVEKKREIYLYENVRIHLDEVTELGSFFEFEAVYDEVAEEPAQTKKVKELMKAFEIKDRDLIHGSYRELKMAH